MNDKYQASMQYCRSKHGLNYACWVAYRPIEEIEDLDEYIRVQTRATFVFEDQAKWFCKQFNDAITQKVEPFQLGNECVGFDSSLASIDRECCNWTQDYDDSEQGTWKTGCDNYWYIVEGSPSDNNMKFCHGCGKPIAEHPYVDTEDTE